MIDDTVSTANPISRAIGGGELTRGGARAQNTLISVQVEAAQAGDFEVHLEAGVVTGNRSPDFTMIGEFTERDDVHLSVFPVSMGVRYRFRHVDGVPCRVSLTG